MESSFLIEKKIIATCFNPIRDSVFILGVCESDTLELTEEDISKNVIIRRFKTLMLSECNIVNKEFKKMPKDTYEGFGLYFWELAKKLIVIYPYGYLLIYDYQTNQLNYHFQCHGKKAYVIRNLIGSPIQRSLFISAEKMRNVYHLSYDNMKNISYQKLVIPKEEIVYDLVCHTNEKFIFVACSDSIIRIFDYSDPNKMVEIKNGLVDVAMGKDNKPVKNQAELIKKSNLLSVLTIDLNHNGNFLLSGNENGNVYLWDALSAIKNKRILLTKERFSGAGIFSIKYIKTKQLENLNRFIILTKEGKFYICNIVIKDENNTKTYQFNKLYENSIFKSISLSINKYNVMNSNFISISNFSNIICLKWPTIRVTSQTINDKKEDIVLFPSFNAKFFFIYDNIFPKINYAIATRMKFMEYEDYIPISNKSNLVFERRIYFADNFFIYYYDVMSSNTKKILNYTKEFNLKSIYPLKLEVTQLNEELSHEVYFVILIENENSQKLALLIQYNMEASQILSARKFEDIIDFVILGKDEETVVENILFLNKNKQHAIVYNIKENKKETKHIEGSVQRLYWTPFSNGNCVLYRNVLSELKFSSNLKSSDPFEYKCINDNSFRLDYSEREIDLVWKKVDGLRYICAISMIEKIVITDETMKTLYSYKLNLIENPYIISSMFFVGKTLFYSKGNSIYYFYGEDNLHQKIFSNDQSNGIISGVLSDRYILVSKISGSKELNNVEVTTPIINPLEPILLGYLDNTNIDYNLVKEAITNMFTNQFSTNLVNKLLKKDLKEVAWALVSDTKSSFQNVEKKIQILNDLLKFDLCLDYILPNKNLKNEMEMDELLWKIQYDHSFDYIKNILIGQCNILINYGQLELAIKILEILGDCSKALNLLLISSSKDEFEKLKIIFQAKRCLSYTDNLLVNNIYFCAKDKFESVNNYNKIFDTYKGEPFPFGANQDKLKILSVKDASNKINKKNSHICNFQKKILSYGETAFTQYAKVFSKETSKYELMNVCNLIIKKIEHFYGHKNTVYEMNSKIQNKNDFTDYNVPLSDMKQNANQEEEDNSIDEYTDEISETLYLSAYFHCDKGSGKIVEDITDHSTEGTLSMTNPPVLDAQVNSFEENAKNEDSIYWTSVLEEFQPLENEDKWGRRDTGSHAIIFSSKLIIKI